MYDLIGKPYRLGADGSDPDGALDCIHLVYVALERLDVPTPKFKPDWYTARRYTVLRDLLNWGNRVTQQGYDGDVALLPQDRWVFGAVWNQGMLHFGTLTETVTWSPLERLSAAAHFFRTKES